VTDQTHGAGAPDDDDSGDGSRMSFLEHLEELRRRRPHLLDAHDCGGAAAQLLADPPDAALAGRGARSA